jgi:periplasmic protein CpxP/Spy
MNKLTFVSIAVVILLILNGALVALIFFKKTDVPRHVRADEIIISRLELNGDQIERFEELKRAHRKKVMECHDSISVLKRALIGGLKTALPDTHHTYALANSIGQQQKEVELATFSHFAALRELCDDRQKQLFDEFIQEIAQALDRPHPEKKPPM